MTAPADAACTECGKRLARRQGRAGVFWACVAWPACRGRAAPTAPPADAATTAARAKAQQALDTIWKRGELTRSAAYKWLRTAMQMTDAQAHIGKFTKEQCEAFVQRVAERNER